MYCTNCGKEINVNNKFCKNCGSIIENEEQEQQEKIVNDRTKEKGMKYYDFFSKYYLLIITIVNLIGLTSYQSVEVWDIYVWLEFLIVLVVYIVVPMKLLSDMQKPTEFTFMLLIAFLSTDYIYRVTISSFTTYYQYLSTSLITYIITAIIMYGIWFIPNIIYFIKRRNVFKN